MAKPAKVKFIGNEADYIWKGESKFTYGKVYDAFFLEYWEGERTSLHVRGNDDCISDFIPFSDFEVLSDEDHVLNYDEAIVKCIVDDDDLFDLKFGSEYKAIGRDKDGMYLVMDESYDCYFYPAECFEIIDDPCKILSRQSVYYSFDG